LYKLETSATTEYLEEQYQRFKDLFIRHWQLFQPRFDLTRDGNNQTVFQVTATYYPSQGTLPSNNQTVFQVTATYYPSQGPLPSVEEEIEIDGEEQAGV
jgi:hypothetical protein